MSGILNIEDLATILNPNNVKGSFIPDKIQHYPIINSKLHVLLGEESKRRFDYKLVVTNPEEVNEVEMNKLTQ
jgi:hypothetical protein